MCMYACVCACCVFMCSVYGCGHATPAPPPQVFSCLCDILETCTSFCAILHATDLIFTPRDRDQINLLARVRAKHRTLASDVQCKDSFKCDDQ